MASRRPHEACLVLSDGTVFPGQSIGTPGTAVGEVVFSTAMTGYQEMLTDPSYRGQILTLTYPLIGNYGTTAEDAQSDRVQVAGLIIRELSPEPSSWRADEGLREYLQREGVVALAGIDTRALTRRLRTAGVMMGVLTTELSPKRALSRLKAAKNYGDLDFVAEVTAKGSYQWREGAHGQSELRFGEGPAVCVVDYGVKRNILRYLAAEGCEVFVFPAQASAAGVMRPKPDVVVLSPGPGNPARLDYAIATVRDLLETSVPLVGICLGHQLLAHAAGGGTVKLKFGHRGANHPVQDLATGAVRITSQNHGYAVDAATLAGSGFEVTQRNLNDGTVEGLRHTSKPVWSVQYHPEASPGPTDSRGLFHTIAEMAGSAGR